MPSISDPEQTHHRSGISVLFSGDKGVDYMEEYLYHDKLMSDRKVVYIRSTTQIEMVHNAMNTAHYSNNRGYIIGADGLDGVPNSGDEGIIRYKVDGDMSYGPYWTAEASPRLPAYTTPLTFGTMTYPGGAAGTGLVLGRVGNNGAPYQPKSGHYHYGIQDSVGDEWHAIQVADDDMALPPRTINGSLRAHQGTTSNVWWCSDGKYYTFVVDPKTPGMTVRATGNGQFYTTPAKVNYLPTVHAQTTYILPRAGTVTFELRDLFGANVEYRINGGSWVTAANPTITDAAFNSGTNTLEYRCSDTPSIIRTRTVVKNPGFPSAGESHGWLYFGDAANYAKMLTKITRAPFKSPWDKAQKDDFVKWDLNRRTGRRFVFSQAADSAPPGGSAMSGAVFAKVYGLDTKPSGTNSLTGQPFLLTYAEYAKEALLEGPGVLDNVGVEYTMNGPAKPNAEHYYRGYWDYGARLGHARAYDLLISIYRSDQHPNGITPVEDHFIRDSIARCANEVIMFMTGQTGSDANIATPAAGMWSSSLQSSAIYAMFALPSYSTPYFGTSGLDGNATTYPWTPSPTQSLTWKKLFLDEDYSLSAYPGQIQRLGFDDANCRSSPTYTYPIASIQPPPNAWFIDKKDYWGFMSAVFSTAYYTLAYQYPSKPFWPMTLAAMNNAHGGAIYGAKSSSGGYGPGRTYNIALLSGKFASLVDQCMDGGPYDPRVVVSTSYVSQSNLMNGNHWAAFVGYDDTYYAGGSPTLTAPSISSHPQSQTVAAGANGSFSVTASGSAPLSYQWAKGGVNISGATASTLSLTGVQLSDAGSYTCTVTNAQGGVTSNAATLTVNAVAVAPTITTHPQSATLTAGQSASFSVVASGTAPLTYQWMKDGANIPGANSATYTRVNVGVADTGIYACQVTNGAGSILSLPAALSVQAPSVSVNWKRFWQQRRGVSS